MDKKIVLTKSQLREIARFEDTFESYIDCYDELENIETAEYYQITLEDLYTAIKNIIKANPSFSYLCEFWYWPLLDFDEQFGISTACGYNSNNNDLLVTAEDYFEDLWYNIAEDFGCHNDDDFAADCEDFVNYLDKAERYFADKDKPLIQRKFTNKEKKRFIKQFNNDTRLKNASEEELELCRKFTDELCKINSKTALYLKGYACYGGNRLYECDWEASRECITTLYKKTNDPSYANTLGYIYYYGRCTGGEPDYKQAFDYFLISALHGYYEGAYKLADMYLHGYACVKSPSIANSLYSLVYNDSYGRFLNGEDTSFADAALRMGNIYAKGIDVEITPESALYYYLQAEYAIKLRAKKTDFFGNTTVAMGVQNAIDKIKEDLPVDFFVPYLNFYKPIYLYGLTENNNKVKMNITKRSDGNMLIKAQRIPVKTGNKVSPVLICEARLNYCELTYGVTLEAINAETSFEDGTVKYDWCEENYKEDRFDFYLNDELIGWIKCDQYRMSAPQKEQPSGQKLKFASVVFTPGGKKYDYLCDIENVSPGDTVIVNGYNGETEVQVIDFYEKYESEIGIPVERYKKVIKKS